MQWLSDPQATGAEAVTEDLAMLVFGGDAKWPDNTDRAADYAAAISPRLTGETETRFIALTGEDGDPAAFIDWMMPVLKQWQAPAAGDEAGQEDQGLSNPNYESDPTPGTQYYRHDPATGTYLYSDTADGSDWASYEQRRYAEPAWDDNYGLNYRYDNRDGVYEWYDEQAGAWNSQDWAEQYAASRSSQAGAAAQASPAAAEGAYPVVTHPGTGLQLQHSGDYWFYQDQWLTDEQLTAAAGSSGPTEAQGATEEVSSINNELLAENPEFAGYDPQELMSIVSEVLREAEAG
jgi:hypothetical protein